MAGPKSTPLLYGSSGLNTILDPERIVEGSRENGYIAELAQAVNVTIDDLGQVVLRGGSVAAQAGGFHSLFCDGGACFVIQERTNDAALMQVNTDLTLTGVRSGLTKNLRMTYGQVAGDTFYSNGTQNGFVRAGTSSAWPVGTYTGPDDNAQFTTAPLASHMVFRPGGQCLLAAGAAVFINHEPFQYGLFSLRRGYIGFASDVTMLADVRQGVFVSDGTKNWFLRKLETGWYDYRQELVDDAPVIEGSLAFDRVRLRDININSDGFGRVWCSADGICLGTDEGFVINLTKDRIKYPAGYNYGASLLRGTAVINTVS